MDQMRVAAKPRVIFIILALLGGCDGAPPEADPGTTSAPANLVPEPIPEGAQAWSLLGEPLFPAVSEETFETQTVLLDQAQADLDAAPTDADPLIWVGRRHAYLGRYRTAIEIYTRGLELHPQDARFLRHRGHRFISVREFDNAVTDLEHATELIRGSEDKVEPDGLPNARGIPTSSLHYNVWYHLGLARYLLDDLEGARLAYEECLAVLTNNDAVVACSYWLWLINRRLGNTEAASAIAEGIPADLDIIENSSYHQLLLLFKGERTPEDLLGAEGEDLLQNTTLAYGVGAWYMVAGEQIRSQEIFRNILGNPSQWAAFGYIAAEAEIARREGSAVQGR